MTAPLMRLRGVAVTARVRVELEIASGEAVAILAGEGVGKSRLARIMAGLVVPESGEVLWRGRAGGIGMVFRIPELRFLCVTPREEVRLTPFSQGLRGEALAERLEEALACAGVASEWLDREWHGLSAGQRYRVGLAATLAAAPELLLLDEPGSMLSDAGEVALAACLRDLAQTRGMARVVFTSRASRAALFAERTVAL
ncbi:MAG: energy-coupling factor ABC transporter ATP-binding protein [Magnetococcales bacterium]|nr:energy-coupling factor ABC transporter ATP-binding protein [Magnetococcales bacterium]